VDRYFFYIILYCNLINLVSQWLWYHC